MIDSLSSLTKLEQLEICGIFSDYASRRPPPLTRTVLPALTSFVFNGEGDFLVRLFAQTHFPQLKDVRMMFHRSVIFDVSLISRFMGYMEAFDRAHMRIIVNIVEVMLSSSRGATDSTMLWLATKCRDSIWMLRYLTRGCFLLSPRFTNSNCVDFLGWGDGSVTRWTGNVETRWRTIFQLFTAVENLYLSKGLAEYVVFALQEHAAEQGLVAEVLSALQNVFIENLESFKSGLQEAIGKFVAARELSGRPVTVQHWVK
jgi:hypothetical protein